MKPIQSREISFHNLDQQKKSSYKQAFRLRESLYGVLETFESNNYLMESTDDWTSDV